MQLRILRGIHTAAMVDEAVAAARGAQTVFVEMVGTEESRSTFIARLNAIVSGADENEKGDAHMYAAIARGLRGSGAVFVAVDEVAPDLDSFNAYNEYIGATFLIDTLTNLKDADMDNLYSIIRREIDDVDSRFYQRDRLVARQVATYVTENRSVQPSRVERMTLIQGYFHVSKKYLQKELPDVKISTTFYNMKGLDELRKYPEIILLLHKRMYPSHAVPEAIIDQAIVMSLAFYADMPPETQDVTPEYITEYKRRVNHVADTYAEFSDGAIHELAVRLVKYAAHAGNPEDSTFYEGIKVELERPDPTSDILE